MSDEEFNEALEETAEAMNDVSRTSYDNRRQALNLVARQRGIIDQQEDLIDDYRGTGMGALRGVQKWLKGEKEDNADIKTLLDDLEENQEPPEPPGGIGKRELLAALGGAVVTSFGLGAIYAQEDEDENEDPALSEEKWYGWNDVEGCLSSGQKDSLNSSLNVDLEDGQYKLGRNGDGFDIFYRDPESQNADGKLNGQEVYCEIR